MNEKLPRYEKLPDKPKLWCRVHKRQATHVLFRSGMEPHPCCDPKLGGILAVCQTEQLIEDAQ